MGNRINLNQLEKMKTHEIADLLADVVLLLRRLPDVECRQLIQQDSDNGHRDEHEAQPTGKHKEHTVVEQGLVPTPSFTREELEKKRVPELKKLAKELNVLVSSSTKKEDLINKILARPTDGRSEQRAMLDN
jgi:Rho termination factor, N-terminal domain